MAMVSAARDELRNLFERGIVKLWFMAVPSEDHEKTKPRPPPSNKSYQIKQIHALDESCHGPMEAIAYIGRGIDSVPGTVVNGTFWSKFINTLAFELTDTGGLGWLRATSTVKPKSALAWRL